MTKRRYSVSGTDEAGDTHIFCTDNQQRAEDMRQQMSQKLRNVEFVETTQINFAND
jgi:hypothetical protein